MFNLLMNKIYTDAPEPWQYYFQDSATPVLEGIVQLHDDVMFYLVLIVIGVLWMILITLQKFSNVAFVHKYLTHGTLIEIIWTITPAFVLMAIAFPSFKLLYLMDEVIDPSVTIKAIGHQWYWSYEYSDYYTVYNNNTLYNNISSHKNTIEPQNDDNQLSSYGNLFKQSDVFQNNLKGTKTGIQKVLGFDSYMIPQDDLNLGQFRLLETDRNLILPINTHLRVLVTAADVLHSWAIPSLGVKIDCVPGRLNQTSMLIKRPGFYYGQCSEICGVQHGFMPICIQATSLNSYLVNINMMLADSINENK
jgi:cytochrome c oxidase subunit 2